MTLVKNILITDKVSGIYKEVKIIKVKEGYKKDTIVVFPKELKN